MTNTERIQANNEELRECIRTAENLPDAGSTAEVMLQDKSVIPAEGAQTIVADDGYDGLGTVTVEAIPDDYVIPGGIESITTNGLHNVRDYEFASVDVPIPEGYLKPTGTLEISDNGQYNVAEYESVNVEVSGSGGSDSDLPSGWKRCDFIQFSGSSMVDTGIIGDQDTQIFASFTWENSAQRYLLGCAHADNTAAITAYMNGSWRFGDKVSSKSISIKNPLLPYSALLNKTTIAATSGVTTISGVEEFETIGTLLFGGCRSSNGAIPTGGLVGKGLRLIIWKNDARVLDLIPVTDDNGTYRFWDLVGKEFHDSVTSAALSGGNW